jgi:hypothetical protein
LELLLQYHILGCCDLIRFGLFWEEEDDCVFLIKLLTVIKKSLIRSSLG